MKALVNLSELFNMPRDMHKRWREYIEYLITSANSFNILHFHVFLPH